MRQSLYTAFDPKRGVSIATLAYDYPAGYKVPEHAHGSHQLIYATEGMMEISVERSYWTIPPYFAIWIPARTVHKIRMPAPVSMRTLYLRPNLRREFRNECRVIHVGPLLRELVLEAVRIGQLQTANRLHRALRDLILSQLDTATSIPTLVRMPADKRARSIAEWVITHLTEAGSLPRLCTSAGTSVRTVQRAFRRDVGIDFESWRRHVRLARSIELLVAGNSVKEIAFEIGYVQPSAFIEMFKASFGMPPKAWLAAIRNPVERA